MVKPACATKTAPGKALSVKPGLSGRLLRSDQMIEVFHAAGMTDVSKRWLDRACQQNLLPYTRVGRYRRFTERAILSYLNASIDKAEYSTRHLRLASQKMGWR